MHRHLDNLRKLQLRWRKVETRRPKYPAIRLDLVLSLIECVVPMLSVEGVRSPHGRASQRASLEVAEHGLKVLRVGRGGNRGRRPEENVAVAILHVVDGAGNIEAHKSALGRIAQRASKGPGDGLVQHRRVLPIAKTNELEIVLVDWSAWGDCLQVECCDARLAELEAATAARQLQPSID